MTTSGSWKVVTWKVDTAKMRAGGTSLVYNFDSVNGFAVCTGPNPWGAGVWGPFPASAATEVRDLRADDSWPVSGCPTERWTARDVLRSFKKQWHVDTSTLEAAIEAAS